MKFGCVTGHKPSLLSLSIFRQFPLLSCSEVYEQDLMPGCELRLSLCLFRNPCSCLSSLSAATLECLSMNLFLSGLRSDFPLPLRIQSFISSSNCSAILIVPRVCLCPVPSLCSLYNPSQVCAVPAFPSPGLTPSFLYPTSVSLCTALRPILSICQLTHSVGSHV